MRLLVVLLAGLSIGMPTGIEDVMACVYQREQELDCQIQDARFFAEYRYEEREPDGSIRVIETCTRRVFIRGDQQHIEFLIVTSDGRILEGRERERKIRELSSKGLIQDQTRMPFRQETREEYRYELADSVLIEGHRTWLVRFSPIRKTGRHVVGQAWLLADSFCDIIRLQFQPDRLPFVVSNMNMTLTYEPAGDRTLPVRFNLEMRVLVRFIITLAERYISIEDQFSDFRFNTGLPDSVFNGQ